MDINFSILSIFILSVFMFLSTPGPVTLLVINTSLKSGWRNAIKTIIGTNSASLVLIAISWLIIQGLLVLDQKLLTVLKIAGSIYLFYYAYLLIKEVLNKQTQEDVMKNLVFRKFFIQGFTIGISNPKDVMFFVAFFPQFINITPSKTGSLISLTLAWIILDYVILSFYAFSVKKVISANFKKIFFIISAILFFMIGIFSIANGIHYFFID